MCPHWLLFEGAWAEQDLLFHGTDLPLHLHLLTGMKPQDKG